MTDEAPVVAAVHLALRFLAGIQLDHGEFPTYVWRTDQGPPHPEPDPSPFGTAQVVYALTFAPPELANLLVPQALDSLQAEREPPGVWRFYSSRNPRHALIPPDLDDTCVVAFVLDGQGRRAGVDRSLLLANRDARGLFHTWLTPRRPMPMHLGFWRMALRQWRLLGGRRFWPYQRFSPGDVDLAVNANVLLYLGDCAETRPIVEALSEIVRAGRESASDRYYVRPMVVLYLISRACYRSSPALAAIRKDVTGRVGKAARRDGSFGDELDTALAVCTLLNYGEDCASVEGGIRWLVKRQASHGAWPCLDMWGGPGRVTFWGSEAITTALCLEALLRYLAGGSSPDFGRVAIT